MGFCAIVHVSSIISFTTSTGTSGRFGAGFGQGRLCGLELGGDESLGADSPLHAALRGDEAVLRPPARTETGARFFLYPLRDHFYFVHEYRVASNQSWYLKNNQVRHHFLFALT